jgi:hypothetical protein
VLPEGLGELKRFSDFSDRVPLRISVDRVYFVNAATIFLWICEVQYYATQRVFSNGLFVRVIRR